MGNKTFASSRKKIGFLAQKRPYLAQKMHFCVILEQILAFLLVSWLVVVARGLYLLRHLFTLLSVL